MSSFFMQEIDEMVSIIIPAYNADKFLEETILSVKSQTYPHYEVIIVNDGSTDQTAKLAGNYVTDRIKLINQANQGVSAARNNGLKEAQGEYVVFLDADDLLTPLFIETRVNLLKEDKDTGFAGGWVETFPVQAPVKKAVAEDPEKEILFFSAGRSTVPSNYMFRKKTLLQNNLEFNTNLSSTADRFFLLQVSKYAGGKGLGNESGKLLYRVSESSMSHQITPQLIYDNERFYKELVRKSLLPVSRRRQFKSLYFFSLGLGFAKIKHFRSFGSYMCRSAVVHPFFFAGLVFRKIFQYKTSREGAGDELS